MKRKVLLSIFSIIVSLSLFYLPFANGQHIKTKENYFSLLQATSQRFSAGMRDGTSGIEYSFFLTINTKESLIFDSVWIGKEAYKVVVTKQRKFISNAPITYTKGDTISLRITANNIGENNCKQSKKISVDSIT